MVEGNIRKMSGEVSENPSSLGSTTFTANAVHYTHITCDEDIRAQSDAVMAPPGGVCCDTCSAVGVRLNKCGRCHLAWYCSPECQRTAWRGPGGHKELCKAEGEYRAGDYVMVLVPGTAALVGKVEVRAGVPVCVSRPIVCVKAHDPFCVCRPLVCVCDSARPLVCVTAHDP